MPLNPFTFWLNAILIPAATLQVYLGTLSRRKR